MVQSVKKYYYSAYLHNKSHQGIVATNVAHLNGHTYVATSDPRNPIMKFNTNEGGKLIGSPTYVCGSPKTKIKFLGFIKDKLAVIPKYSWGIHVLNDEGKEHRSITINSQYDLRRKIVEAILYKNTKACRCEDCYHLIGFAQYYGFNIFVQLSCTHKQDHKLLYVIKADLNGASLDCKDDLEVTNEYNYYRLCLDNGLREEYSKGLTFTGLHYDGNRIYLISTYGNGGHLWEMPYFNNISYLGPPILISKLRKEPIGVCSHGSNLIVLCRNMEYQKINYYIIVH